MMPSTNAFDLPGMQLEPWQVEACNAWESGDGRGTFRGTLEIFTGGGKSLIALECIRRAALLEPDLKVAVVVPTMALMRQWKRLILSKTHLADSDVGELHGDRKDTLEDHRVLISVINTAAQRLPEMARRDPRRLMLVIDESHRAGAREFSRVLGAQARFRLGLSATAERDDVDDDGEPIDYDEHVLGQELGGIVYRFDLKAARRIGWLPTFTVHHHGLTLAPKESRRYEELSRKIDDLGDRLREVGIDVPAARSAIRREGETGIVARAFVSTVALRKDLLYRATERTRVAGLIVGQLAARQTAPRVLLFHERIDEAQALYDGLVATELSLPIGLEHSRLPESIRQRALSGFVDGTTPVLVSVKSLVEGIDVPAADVGISVASSSSVRQRVQALGRVLRRSFDGSEKNAEMHILYVVDTVDEVIYEKEDWGDLTGEAANLYFSWELGATSPSALDGPPRTPRPTEDQFFERFLDEKPELPAPWPCDWPRQEWRLDSRGTITDLAGNLVVNPQGAPEAVHSLRPTGGRFRISQKHRLIIVPEVGAGETRAWVVGRLAEPFRKQAGDESGDTHLTEVVGQSHIPALAPGDPYPGPLDRLGGQYRIRQKAGGVISRRVAGGEEFADTNAQDDTDQQAANALRILASWRDTGEAGMTFFVNSRDDAYYLASGAARFLAAVPDGFRWPS